MTYINCIQLVASCVVELFVWGFPNSSGVLLAAYLDDPIYSSQKHARSVLPLVGTLCTGIMYCSGITHYPFDSAYLIINNRPRYLPVNVLLPSPSPHLHLGRHPDMLFQSTWRKLYHQGT